MVFNKQTVLDLLNADFTQDHSRNIENSVLSETDKKAKTIADVRTLRRG